MTAGTSPVRVRAYLHEGSLKAEWVGRLVHHERCWAVGATWTRGRVDVTAFLFEPGDRLVEVFWPDRWFNVIRAATPGGVLKGYYINLATPARLLAPPRDEAGGCWALEYVDLVLDAVVDPGGRWWWLDREAFRAFLGRPPAGVALEAGAAPARGMAAGESLGDPQPRRCRVAGEAGDARTGARLAAGSLARALVGGALAVVTAMAPWDELVAALGWPG
ncbi:MAG: DUF402 domain-containing protein [Symbiobacteriaceae bacterium]